MSEYKSVCLYTLDSTFRNIKYTTSNYKKLIRRIGVYVGKPSSNKHKHQTFDNKMQQS